MIYTPFGVIVTRGFNFSKKLDLLIKRCYYNTVSYSTTVTQENKRKMKKLIVAIVSAAMLLCFTGCDGRDPVLVDTVSYDVSPDIRSIDIDIKAGDLCFKRGEVFAVESNLAHLAVNDDNDRLAIRSPAVSTPFGSGSYQDAVLTVYVPSGAVLDRIDISTGAGRLSIDELAAKSIEFDLGAGEVSIGSLVATGSADIDGGAGRITISGGALNDLDVDMGVGDLNITSRLSGDCQFNMGVGSASITLFGSMDDYRLDVSKGIGAVTVDGKAVTDFGSSGNGSCEIEINGGVGSIDLFFEETEEE